MPVRLYVQDIRTPGNEACLRLEDVHSGGVHTVAWAPYDIHMETSTGAPVDTSNPNLLMTAGSDPVIHLFDVRRAEAQTPLFSFRGHAHPSAKKWPTIHPPKFLNSDIIVAAGESSLALSLYCTKTGTTISRGDMEDYPMAIACARRRQTTDTDADDIYDVAVSCKRGGLVYSLRPIIS